MKRFKSIVLSLIVLCNMGAGLMVPAVAYADPKSDACTAIGSDAACGKTTGLQIGNVIKAAVSILSIVVGIAAVFMIIISGLKYITSGGDASSVASAKSTLIYSLVGLIIAASAYFLINYVLTNVK